jgi:hypothetical protein
MRGEDLFRDLEAQLTAAGAAELEAELADRTRREAARLTLVDRALGSVGWPVSLRVSGVGVVEGVVREVGAQWLLLDEGPGRASLVPLAAVLAVSGLSARSDVSTSAGQVFRRLGLAAALRVVARDRAAVSVWLVDGSTVTGTVDRVGSDFLEVSERHPGDRRERDGRPARTVPFAAVAVVRSGP